MHRTLAAAAVADTDDTSAAVLLPGYVPLEHPIKRGDQVVFIAGKENNRYDSNGNRQPLRGKVIAVEADQIGSRYARLNVRRQHRRRLCRGLVSRLPSWRWI